jgi:hypothetical protein
MLQVVTIQVLLGQKAVGLRNYVNMVVKKIIPVSAGNQHSL